MDVRLSDEQQAIEDGVAKVCAQFGDELIEAGGLATCVGSGGHDAIA